jgi:hypothetical protein
MVTDLSNEIPLCDWDSDWDSNQPRSPDQPKTPVVPKLLTDNAPMQEGWSLAVSIPTTVSGRTHSFIDDLI